MSIEERINLDTINIHHLQEIPEVKLDVFFDPERDIDSAIKFELADAIKKLDRVGHLPERIKNFSKIGSRYKLLWPKEAGQILDQVSDADLIEGTRKILSGTGGILLPAIDEIHHLAGLKIIRPQLDVVSSKDRDVLIRELLEANQSTTASGGIPTGVGMLKIFDPDFFMENPIENFVSKQALENFANHVHRNLSEFSRLAEGDVESMASFRLLYPSYNFELNQYHWINLQNDLKEKADGKESEWAERYIKFAASLKIIAAHRVEVTSPGIVEITNVQDLTSTTPPIPESRKF